MAYNKEIVFIKYYSFFFFFNCFRDFPVFPEDPVFISTKVGQRCDVIVDVQVLPLVLTRFLPYCYVVQNARHNVAASTR